jgi:hypothetical protein
MSKTFRLAALLFGAILLFGGSVCVHAQEDDDPMFPSRKKDDAPRGIQESLSKMRIEKDKKDFNEMLKRGEDAAKLASAIKDGSVAGQQDQIANIGKLVKKIRVELGAEGPDDDPDEVPTNQAEAIRQLKARVNALTDELKKCSRFTVSASAIDRTNEILRLVKYLHG